MVNKTNDDLNSASKDEKLGGGVPGIIKKASDMDLEQSIRDKTLSKEELKQFITKNKLELKPAYFLGKEYPAYIAYTNRCKKTILVFEKIEKDSAEFYNLKACFS